MDGGGRGWRSPAETQRGRTEEAAGASEVEVGEERVGAPAFCSNFLERQTQTNSTGQLMGERGRETRGKVRRWRKAGPDPGRTERPRLFIVQWAQPPVDLLYCAERWFNNTFSTAWRG